MISLQEETRTPGPVFVCGPSRSGTAMVRSALNLHPEVHLSGETHYFDDLRVQMQSVESVEYSEDQRRRCEDYFLALSHRPYGHGGDPNHSRIDRSRFRERLNDIADSRQPDSDIYFEAYCRLDAEMAGKHVWGEKTPRHIFRIDDILSVFPHAMIICMVRDPRAVAASYRDWQNQGGFDFDRDPGHRETLDADQRRAKKSYHPVINAFLWRAASEAALSAQQSHGPERVRVQLFEELVANPEEQMRELLEWLGVEFHADVLNMPMSNSSYQQFRTGTGASAEPVHRWRSRLSPSEIAAIESACGSTLQKVGYQPARIRGAMWLCTRYWATVPIAAARAATANRDRIANLPQYAVRRLMLAFR